MTTYEEMLMNQSAANSAFNASQAEMNRDWQEYMSGTSHQREVKDLILAGLNPVLSANSGSTWQGVSNATADPSSAAGMASLAATAMNNYTQLEMSKISAEATKAAANASAGAMMAAASTSAAAQRYAADQGLASAEVSKGGTMWGFLDKHVFESEAGQNAGDYLSEYYRRGSTVLANDAGSWNYY